MSCEVSVIIPVYNCRSFLKTAVESVISQTVFNSAELILVDDGSTDGSSEICDGFSANYSNIICIHQKNSGVSAARNAGMAEAKGEYIAFLDSDDSYESYFLEKMLNRKSYDLVCCEFYCDEPSEKHLGKIFENRLYTRKDFDAEFYNNLVNQDFYSCWNKLYKRSIIEKNSLRFPEGIKYAEDMVFVYGYLTFCDSFFFIDESLYRYNINSGNTTSVVKNGFDVQYFIYEKQKYFFELWNCGAENIKKAKENFVYKTTCTINSEITHGSILSSYKHIKKVLASDFYPLYIMENYTEFKCLYDKVFFTLLKKRCALLVVLWRKLFDLRSKKL